MTDTASVTPQPPPESAPTSRPAATGAGRLARRAADTWPAMVTAGRIGATEATSSPIGLALSLAFYGAVVIAIGSLWSVAASANNGMIGPFDPPAIITYYLLSELVTIAVPGRVITQTSDHINSASLTADLQRPVAPHWIWVGRQWGNGAAVAVVLGVAGLAASAVFGNLLDVMVPGGEPITGANDNSGTVSGLVDAGLTTLWALAQLGILVLSLVAALTVHILAVLTWSAVGYWSNQSAISWFLYQKLLLIGGGVLLPLNLLPQPVEVAMSFSPWAAISFAPASIGSGVDTAVAHHWLFALQAGWIVVLGALLHWVHHRGYRRVTHAPPSQLSQPWGRRRRSRHASRTSRGPTSPRRRWGRGQR